MTRPRTMVGLGDAQLAERGEQPEAGGLACRVAIEAARLGQNAVVVSRVGQDPRGGDLVGLLRQRGVSTEHLQTDPDLPTGLEIAGIGGARRSSGQTAWDNLQWDYDLTDLAQRTDIVVYGLRAARGGQTRSVMVQFITACDTALRVLDATDRNGDVLDRGVAGPLLDLADIVVVDAEGLKGLSPGAGQPVVPESVGPFLRQHELTLMLWLEGDGDTRMLTAIDARQRQAASRMTPCPLLPTAVVTFARAIRGGRTVGESLEAATTATDWAAEHGAEAIPAEILGGLT